MPLYAAHKSMKEAKYGTIRILNDRFNELNGQLQQLLSNPNPAEGTEGDSSEQFNKLSIEIEQLKKLHDIAKAMPVYPFNAQIVSSFVVSVLLPAPLYLAQTYLASVLGLEVIKEIPLLP